MSPSSPDDPDRELSSLSGGDEPLGQKEEAELLALATLLRGHSLELPENRRWAIRTEVLRSAEKKKRSEASSRTRGTAGWWRWILPALGAALGVLALQTQGLLAPQKESATELVSTPFEQAPSEELDRLLAAQASVLRRRLGSAAATLPSGSPRLPEERDLQAALADYRRNLLDRWEEGR